MEMDPRLTELSQTFELFKDAQIREDSDTSDRLLSQFEALLTGFRALPPSFGKAPHATQEPATTSCNHCTLVTGAMESEDYSTSSGGVSVVDNEEEGLIYATGSSTKLQPRKVACKARWNDAMGMAEVIEPKGKMHVTMGITRDGKIYYSIEEILFLAEIGALVLVDENDLSLSLSYMYKKVVDGKSGCSWEAFEVYRNLKSQGFIVGRHGVPWSLKGSKGCLASIHCSTENVEGVDYVLEEEKSILIELNDLQMEDLRPVFDVYLPNGKFRKSSPGDPASVIYLTGANPPSIATIQNMERRSNGVPMRFSHLDHGRVSFFTFNKVDLPVLP